VIPNWLLSSDIIGTKTAVIASNMTDGISEIREFWIKVVAALSRLAALALFLLVHYVMNRVLVLVFPPNMTRMFDLARDAISVVFLLIYVYLCWDMATVFIPRLKRPSKPGPTPID